MTAGPLRVAFIGAGRMAQAHLHVASRRADAVVVGVHDRAPAQAQAFAATAGTEAFPTVEALVRDAAPDVVHVCTPPASHAEAAMAALDGGAHVYVEKPFAPTLRDARALLDLARSRNLLVCAGHQLLRDPAYGRLMAGAGVLGEVVRVDSHFAFRPVGLRAGRALAEATAAQLIDILPHPLYSLVAALEQFTETQVELAWLHAGPEDVEATLRAASMVGRLSVSLRVRPVASTLTLAGTRGSLTCDFVRSMVIGASNAGTEALEKILNPMIEGGQLISRTARSVVRRVAGGTAYPGLAELIGDFYTAIARGNPSPVTPGHLLRVTAMFEELVDAIRTRVPRTAAAPGPSALRPEPLTVVTGAGGFLGSEIARALPRVRGVGRGPDPGDRHVAEWITADLGAGVPSSALTGAQLVVHAAAETAGGYEAHQRNTLDATRNLLHAMHAAGVSKLVLVSSLSVLRPPRTPWERQDERTPRPADPRMFGAYTWGKSLQEEMVLREAPALGISVRIVRPGALLDRRDPELPGLMGRRLFGRWHLGLGRPGLPMPVCEVSRCAEVIAWVATRFDAAPPVINLFEPAIETRRDVVGRLREYGWDGRFIWVPISVLAAGLTAARTALAAMSGRWPERLAAWSVLRPRRYDPRLATLALASAASGRLAADTAERLPA